MFQDLPSVVTMQNYRWYSHSMRNLLQERFNTNIHTKIDRKFRNAVLLNTVSCIIPQQDFTKGPNAESNTYVFAQSSLDVTDLPSAQNYDTLF
jgi:hypothetical protein